MASESWLKGRHVPSRKGIKTCQSSPMFLYGFGALPQSGVAAEKKASLRKLEMCYCAC